MSYVWFGPNPTLPRLKQRLYPRLGLTPIPPGVCKLGLAGGKVVAQPPAPDAIPGVKSGLGGGKVVAQPPQPVPGVLAPPACERRLVLPCRLAKRLAMALRLGLMLPTVHEGLMLPVAGRESDSNIICMLCSSGRAWRQLMQRLHGPYSSHG